MTNTKILIGLLAALVVALSIYSFRKCPTCPEQSNIVTANVDTLRFQILTGDADTATLRIAVPVIKRDGQIEKSSIVIDNVDMSRLIYDNTDTAHYKILVNERKLSKDTLIQKQQSLNLQKVKNAKSK